VSAPAGFASCIYTGAVMHRRTRPRRHKLAYDVTYFLLDLDELPALDSGITGFGYNRPNLFSFYDRDHGDGSGAPLRGWVESHLAKAGIDIHGGPIRLLCYPRMLGYVFNPISIYFCYRSDQSLAAILYEVTNTFHERHSYLMAVDGPADDTTILRHACAKELYVSPFIEMDMTYHFRIRAPGNGFALSIQEADAEGTLLFASFAGKREALTSANSLLSFMKFPLLTLKVIGGIHWEALKLWLKGVPLVHHPRPPAEPVTIVKREKIAA
jgi:DUF1365 family protein